MTDNTQPEFGRVADVRRIFGIRRGICYRRMKDGTFKTILIHEPGGKMGVRLIDLNSVREYLQRLLQEQSTPQFYDNGRAKELQL